MLGAAAAWTTISSAAARHNPFSIRQSTERSQNEGLHVYLDKSDGLNACLMVLSSAVPHAHRWKTFEIKALRESDNLDYAPSPLEAIGICCWETRFLGLEDFRFENDSLWEPTCLCDSWVIPCIRHLSMTNTLPATFPSSLSSFHLTFLDGIVSKEHPQTLLSFLAQTPRLEDLTLEFKRLDTLQIGIHYSMTILWTVSSLRIMLLDADGSVLEPLFSALKFPALKRLRISLCWHDSSRRRGHDIVIPVCLFPDPSWSRVTSVELFVDSPHGPSNCVGIPIAHIPFTETLSIKTNIRLRPFKILRQLHILQIADSDHIALSWLGSVLRDMKSDGSWADFLLLSISNCALLQKKPVLELFDRGRLRYGRALSLEELSVEGRRRQARLSLMDSPIRRLPYELLEVIVSMSTFGQRPSGRYTHNLNLVCVSRRFRKMAHDIPALWTDIHSEAVKRYSNAVSTCIIRSKDLPLGRLGSK